jgi:hypothetical protein
MGCVSDAWDDVTDAVSDAWDSIEDETKRFGRKIDRETRRFHDQLGDWWGDATKFSFLQPDFPDIPEPKEYAPKYERETPEIMYSPGSKYTEGRKSGRSLGIRSLQIPLNTSGGSTGRTGLGQF